MPTLGGQTGLNTAMALWRNGVLDKFKVEMIGAKPAAIEKAEDREQFKKAMIKIGLEVPKSGVARSLAEAQAVRDEVGLPCVLRPSFTLGGTGGGIAYNREEFNELIARGLDLSPVSEVLIEESVIGWKEFELEVMRDRADNVVIICSIENLDPMASTPATRSPSPPLRHSPTRNISACATPPSPSSARSAWKPAAATSSSPSTPPTGTWWPSR